jgi:hypothetical protein
MPANDRNADKDKRKEIKMYRSETPWYIWLAISIVLFFGPLALALNDIFGPAF